MMKTIKNAFLAILALLFLVSCGLQSIPTANNDVEAAWAEVENQYKRRTDLIPNLVNTVKGYAAHEKDTLEAIAHGRVEKQDMGGRTILPGLTDAHLHLQHYGLSLQKVDCETKIFEHPWDNEKT